MTLENTSMKLMERQMSERESRLRELFIDGKNRGAEYLIVIFDEYLQEERPIFVYPDQDIQCEVITAQANSRVLCSLCLLRDIEEQIAMAMMPLHRIISRVAH